MTRKQTKLANNQKDAQAGVDNNVQFESNQRSDVSSNRSLPTAEDGHISAQQQEDSSQISTSHSTESLNNTNVIIVEVAGVQIPMSPQEFLKFEMERQEREAKFSLEKEKLGLENKRLSLEREKSERAVSLERDLGMEKLKLEREAKEKEIELEKLKVQSAAAATTKSIDSNQEEKKIDRYQQKLTNQKDPEEYFIAFENYARREGWNKETWVRRVSQCIEGKALAAMNSIIHEDFDYEQLKRTILEVFQLSPESYRQKFRTMSKQDNENVKTFIMRLGRTYNSWIKYSDVNVCSEDAKKLSQIMIREQVFQKIPTDMKKHLMQSKILDTAKLAAEAEEYASLDSNYWQNNSNKNQSQKGQKHDEGQNKANGNGKNCYRKRPYNPQQTQDGNNKSQSHQYKQGSWNQNGQKSQGQNASKGQGQYQSAKKFKPNQYQGNRANTGTGTSHHAYRCSQVHPQPTFIHQHRNKSKFIIPGAVEGKNVEIFRDSGCDTTAVHSTLVPEHCYTGNTVEAKGINGQVHVPTAKIHIDCDRFQGELEVLVIEDLDYQVLLGTEVDTWDDLKKSYDLNNSNILVLTRAQKEQQIQKEIIAQDDIRDYANVNIHDNSDSEVDTTECVNTTHVGDDVKNLLEGDVQKLIQLQNQDPTLTKIRASMVLKPTNNEYYKHANGIIMRKCQPETRLRKQVGDQIVVPQQYREHIILIAHDKSGHLGIQKTKDRVTQHFYWPNINHDIKSHCQTCDQCQFMSKTKQSQKLLLRPLPIVDTPFKRVGIDIKGPLPVTEQGNKHILVVCDYATRYPEAIPISDQKADTVAQAMLEIFSRTGLPTEIIHDRGTQFMSKVMSKMCERLGISQIPATPYHQQTNGLTERFIGTLSAMINSLDQEGMENWDRQLPLFLFSYREVPSEFTGYSPFHLMYGRQIRGPLDLIKQGFLKDEEGQDIPSRLLDMSANITTWLANARVKKVQNQAKMKANYDKKARDRDFNVGDKVLVFLPEGGGKFESKWQGPYFIERKVGEVNYQIEMPDKKKSHRLLHANMIKRYYDRQQADNIRHCYCVTGTFQDVCDDRVDQEKECEFDTQYLDQNIGPTYTRTQTWKDAKINDKVTKSQMCEMQQLLSSHEDVFSDVPGKTTVITHKLVTTTEAPIRQRAYRTPQALKSKVQDEIDNMLNLGVIEEINSAYASPIVAVNKPNGDIRLCTNYKALNKVTVVDPYEMPRIDEILEDVAHAKFISTLDLTKGFYQVPLDPQAKAKSAFVAFGHQYAYNVMPFGMVNSSATFQRLVDEVLRDCNSYCRQYIDDVAIFSNSWQEHLEQLDTVLTKIHEAGLTVKPSKCKFAYHQVTYLGHTVGNSQIKPNFDKIKAVTQFPKPVTKKDVRSFLGLTGYYRKFVSHYEDIARPLIDLTKKKEPNTVRWSPSCQSAFQNLKAYLSTEPILKAPDFSKPFLLQTDASKKGIGAILSQLDNQLREHPVIYLSRQLKTSESNYSVSEQECLAIVWSIKKLRYYLQGRKFTVITDHKALQWLDNTKLSNSRLMRWSLILQEFNFDIQYRKGILNTNADSLSRCSISE